MILWQVAAAFLPLAIAMAAQDRFTLAILAVAGAQALFVAGWDFLGGVSGRISLGHALPFGAGAYAAAFLSGWGLAPPGVAVAGGALAGVLAGAVQGTLGARLHRVALALLTLATAEAGREVARMLRVAWPGGIVVGGNGGLPAAVLPLDEVAAARLTAALVAAALTGLLWVSRSRLGLALRLAGTDARLAAASGIDVASVRIAAFAIGGGIAGLAGGLVASLTGRAALTLLSLEWSIFALAVGSAGGPGTIVGPALLAYGFAVALQWLDVPGTVRLSLFAILAIIVVVGGTARVRAQPSRPPRSGVPNA